MLADRMTASIWNLCASDSALLGAKAVLPFRGPRPRIACQFIASSISCPRGTRTLVRRVYLRILVSSVTVVGWWLQVVWAGCQHSATHRVSDAPTQYRWRLVVGLSAVLARVPQRKVPREAVLSVDVRHLQAMPCCRTHMKVSFARASQGILAPPALCALHLYEWEARTWRCRAYWPSE